MSASDPRITLQATVNFIVNNLTDDELLAVNLAAQLGTNPVGVMGFEKAKALFTENRDGHPAVHEEIRAALFRAVSKRFNIT